MWFQAMKRDTQSLNRISPNTNWRLIRSVCLPTLCLLGSHWFVACNRTQDNPLPLDGANATDSKNAPVQGPLKKIPQLQITSFIPPDIPNPGYVGPQACATCHRERVEECMPTSHFRTCRVPDVRSLPRGFQEGQGSFRRNGDSVEFQTFMRGNNLVQATLETTFNGTRRVESSIDLLYGANPISDEVYLSWRPDDSMWELPVAWVYANDCWGASGFDRDSMAIELAS